MMNPFLQGHYEIDVFLTPCRLNGWGGVRELHAISGPSADTWVPGGSIADDKVTRLRLNLCYLHLIIVSCVLVPALHPTRREESYLSYHAVPSEPF